MPLNPEERPPDGLCWHEPLLCDQTLRLRPIPQSTAPTPVRCSLEGSWPDLWQLWVIAVVLRRVAGADEAVVSRVNEMAHAVAAAAGGGPSPGSGGREGGGG